MAGGEPSALNGRKAPPLLDDLGMDVREFFGLDPWPPRPPLNVLQRARIARGLTQDELAEELGISRQTVSSVERRRHVPSVRLALAIAVALRGTVEDLFPAEELVRRPAAAPANKACGTRSAACPKEPLVGGRAKGEPS
jgi:putative transcriptional regulator